MLRIIFDRILSKKAETAAFQIADESKGNVTITLEEGSNNILKGGEGAAALQKNGGEDSGRLTIDGRGALEAVAAGCSSESEAKKSIYIGFGSGIGGGWGECNHITIAGGKIIAIGGGAEQSKYGKGSCIGGEGIGGHDINICGGNVTAIGGDGTLGTSTGAGGAAGIGGTASLFGGAHYEVTISGGVVNASSRGDGPGIGNIVHITGGTVDAESAEGAGIGGGGNVHESAEIYITGGVINARSYSEMLPAIGIAGYGSPVPTAIINISGGVVNAFSTISAGIGSRAGNLDLTITGGIINATGGDGNPGLILPYYCDFNSPENDNLIIDGDCVVNINGSQSNQNDSAPIGSHQSGDYEQYKDCIESTWRGIVFKNNCLQVRGRYSDQSAGHDGNENLLHHRTVSFRRMIAYILKRILYMAVVLLIVTTITFFLLHAIPGDPITAMVQDLPEETRQNYLAAYGFDRPVIEQYFLYLRQLFSGDLGQSLRYPGRKVAEIVANYSPVSALTGGIALLIGVALGLGCGKAEATRRAST